MERWRYGVINNPPDKSKENNAQVRLYSYSVGWMIGTNKYDHYNCV